MTIVGCCSRGDLSFTNLRGLSHINLETMLLQNAPISPGMSTFPYYSHTDTPLSVPFIHCSPPCATGTERHAIMLDMDLTCLGSQLCEELLEEATPSTTMKPINPDGYDTRTTQKSDSEAPVALCSLGRCKRAATIGDRCQYHSLTRCCKIDGCTNKLQSRGLCIRHGGGSRCQVDGCPNGSQSRGRCKAHGGGTPCNVDGCKRGSQGGGRCSSHGGGKKCNTPGCTRRARRQGKCPSHGDKRPCKIAGCNRVGRGGGLCYSHRLGSDSE